MHNHSTFAVSEVLEQVIPGHILEFIERFDSEVLPDIDNYQGERCKNCDYLDEGYGDFHDNDEEEI